MPLGEHERIGVALAAHRRHTLDPIAARDESGDAGVVLEANAQVLGAMGGEIAREHPRIPAPVARRGQPRLRDTALDDVPSRGMGLTGTRQQPLSRHRQEPEKQHRPVPRHRRAGPSRALAQRPRGPMARGRRGDPAAGVYRMPPERSAESALARHRRRRYQPARVQDRPVRCAALRGRASAYRGAAPVRATPRRSRSLDMHTAKATIPSDSSGGWVCTDAKLSPLRLHDLRHTVASQAVMSGENLRSSGGCSGIGGTGPRRATHTSPTAT